MEKLNMTGLDKTLIMINTRRSNKLISFCSPGKPHFYLIMFMTPALSPNAPHFLNGRPLICETSGLRNSCFSDFHLSLEDLQIITVKFPYQNLKKVDRGPKITETNQDLIISVVLNIAGCHLLLVRE